MAGRVDQVLEHLMANVPPKKKKKNTTNVGKDVEKKDPRTLLVGMYKHYEKHFGASSKKLKIKLPYNPAIELLGRHPKNCKCGYNKDTFTAVFNAALFTMAKLWTQPKMPHS
jgi:hypothetical protein